MSKSSTVRPKAVVLGAGPMSGVNVVKELKKLGCLDIVLLTATKSDCDTRGPSSSTDVWVGRFREVSSHLENGFACLRSPVGASAS